MSPSLSELHKELIRRAKREVKIVLRGMLLNMATSREDKPILVETMGLLFAIRRKADIWPHVASVTCLLRILRSLIDVVTGAIHAVHLLADQNKTPIVNSTSRLVLLCLVRLNKIEE